MDITASSYKNTVIVDDKHETDRSRSLYMLHVPHLIQKIWNLQITQANYACKIAELVRKVCDDEERHATVLQQIALLEAKLKQRDQYVELLEKTVHASEDVLRALSR